jgi:glycosyltransferase involved in cell wall biosynthesis
MKVCVISPYSHYSGHHWTYAVEMAEALDTAGCRVKVFTSARPDSKSLLRSTIPCRSVLPFLNPVYRWLDQDRKRNPTLAKILQNIETLAVMMAALPSGLAGWHLHFIDARILTLLLFVIFFPVRVTCLILGNYPFGDGSEPSTAGGSSFRHRFSDFLHRRAFQTGRFRLNCETEEVRSNWLAWLPYAKIQTIPVAIQIPQRLESKSGARRSLGLSAGRTIFLIFGTHRSDKDYRTIIRAAKACKDQPHLIFAGPVISENDPKIALNQEGFSDATVFNQFILGQMADRLFASADAIILPYPKNYSKGSAVLLQAVKYLRPLLATNCPLFGRFVPDHKVGFLYEYGDAGQLALRMSELHQRVAANPERLPFEEELTQTRAEYSWETVVEKFKAYFQPAG